jgi:uncharacterized protein (TIGR00369 family)
MALVMTAGEIGRFLREEFPQVASEFVLDRLEEDALHLRLVVAERHLRPGGTVSGPAIFGLADVAAYLAVLARIGPVALAVTTSASIDFLRKPGPGRDLTAQVRVLKLGRVLAVADVLVYSDGMAEPVARASVTYSIPPKATGPRA